VSRRLLLGIGIFQILITTLFSQATGDIKLLPPSFEKQVTLFDALKNRKTSRSFSDKELSLQQLSDLLWAATGVNRPESGKRTAPTAHDDREIDVYVAMAAGFYLYDPDQHVLKLIHHEDIRSATGRQGFVETAPINLIFVADYRRMKGDQSSKDFYAATDTGFISQNVYLYCAAEGLATVVRGMVERSNLAEKMKLHPDEHIVLTQTVGPPR
jgi:SagB-type dehydrogenase family enzyme